MTEAESQRLLDLARAWKQIAETHDKAKRRARSLARHGRDDYQFYLTLAAHEEIKAEQARNYGEKLEEVVKEIQAGIEPKPDDADLSCFDDEANSVTGL